MFYTCTRLRAIALGLVSLVLAPAVVTAQSSTPNTVEGFLNASEWFVEYEATFVVNHKWDTAYDIGTVSRTTTMNRVLSGSKILNVRSGGSTIMMLRMMSDPTFQNLSAMEQQSKMSALVMNIDDIANWIGGGLDIDEDASYEEMQAAGIQQMNTGSAKLDYRIVEQGVRLYDEDYKAYYDYVDTTTYKGSGTVMPMEDIKLEMIGSTKHYLLTLTTVLQDMSQNSVKTWNHRIVTWDGLEPGISSRAGETNLTNFPPPIEIDDSTYLFGAVPLVEAEFDPSKGKIVGEKTVPAHYTYNARVFPGTLTFKYALTPKG